MRYIELFEGRTAPLYHGCGWVSASHILELNALEARTTQKASQLFHHLFSQSKYANRGVVSGEAEEFVIGSIKNLEHYLTEIRIAQRWYDNYITNGTAERVFTNGVLGLKLLVDHPKLNVV